MKSKILILIIGLSLIAVNVFAAGDLLVNGKLGVGQSTPSAKIGVNATDNPTFEGNFTKTTNAFFNANSLQVYDSDGGGTTGTTALLFNLFHSAAGGVYAQGLGAMNASINLDGGGTWINAGLGVAPFVAKLSFRNNSANYDIDTVSLMRLSLSTNPDFSQSVTVDNLTGLKVSPTLSAGIGTINGTNWYGLELGDFAHALGGSITTNIATSAGLWMEKQTIGTNNYGIVLDGDGAGADLVFGAAGGACRPSIYSTAGYVKAKNKDCVESPLSPHDPETGEWIFYSKNLKTGKTVRVNMEKLVKAVEKITGETFMIETLEEVNK